MGGGGERRWHLRVGEHDCFARAVSPAVGLRTTMALGVVADGHVELVLDREATEAEQGVVVSTECLYRAVMLLASGLKIASCRRGQNRTCQHVYLTCPSCDCSSCMPLAQPSLCLLGSYRVFSYHSTQHSLGISIIHNRILLQSTNCHF